MKYYTKTAYQREILVRQNKILNEEKFVAETGKKYAEATRKLYPKLSAMARTGKITPWNIFHCCPSLELSNQCLVRVRENTGLSEIDTLKRLVDKDCSPYL